MRRWRVARSRRVVIAGLTATLALAACTNPGIKLKEGGSELWTGNPPAQTSGDGRVAANADARIQVQDITPALVRGLQSQRGAKPAVTAADTPPIAYEYRIGPGDILNIVVWNHPELTSPAGPGVNQTATDAGRLVRADGTIFYPYVGVVKVGGKTMEEVRQQLQSSLTRVLQDPQVDVRVVAFRSQQVLVTSDLGSPCVLPISDKPLTVLDALGTCSAQRPAAGTDAPLYYHSSAVLSRGGQSGTIDLGSVYRGGHSAGALTVLQNGDRLHFADNSTDRIFLVGEFDKQTALAIPVKGLTLADAIADAGGLNLSTANTGRIYVVRGFVERQTDSQGNLITRLEPVIYQLNASSADALILADLFPLEPRDVVFASSATLVNWNRALAQILPTLNAIFQSYIVYDR